MSCNVQKDVMFVEAEGIISAINLVNDKKEPKGKIISVEALLTGDTKNEWRVTRWVVPHEANQTT